MHILKVVMDKTLSNIAHMLKFSKDFMFIRNIYLGLLVTILERIN